MRLLPAGYALALRLRERGRTAEIPGLLDIAPEAVPTLLRLAEAKLTRLMEGGGPAASGSSEK